MKCSIEILYHLSCQQCNKWFSFGDIPVAKGQQITCAHCGKTSTVEILTNGENTPVEGVSWILEK